MYMLIVQCSGFLAFLNTLTMVTSLSFPHASLEMTPAATASLSLGRTQLFPHTSSQKQRLFRPRHSTSERHFLRHLRFPANSGFRGHVGWSTYGRLPPLFDDACVVQSPDSNALPIHTPEPLINLSINAILLCAQKLNRELRGRSRNLRNGGRFLPFPFVP